MERPNGTPTLRSRAARRKSIDNDVNASTGSASGRSTPALRITSPIPRSHPSRPAGAPAPKALREASAAVSDIWGTSWSALQGLASNVLGNEADSASRKSRPPWSVQRRRTSTSAPPTQWGPSAPAGSRVGMGSQEERESKVRELKRRDLLNATGDTMPDAAGRMKRRNSDDRSFSAEQGEEQEADALVYIHHVRKEDTLAGITIKFNCTPAVLRKANRMWPNDNIQTKKVVVLPVDACGVKGRPVPAPDSALEDTAQARLQTLAESTQSTSLDSYKPQSRENRLTPTVSHSSVESEPPWKHESWVLLPNDSKPTEIGRMPRRTLGFFPPARRKSVTFSDVSPPASLDLPRSSISTDRAGSHGASPKQPAGRARPASIRTSSMSMARGRGRSGSNSFLLHGPGGVGTLDKNTKSPGPAPDGLYKLLAPHLPNVEPPPDQEYFTPWAPSLLEADSGTSTQHVASGSRTPLGPNLDLQELGGAIEGWIRKVGSQASKILSEPNTPGQGKRSAVPVIGTVGGDIGDLIELRDDAFESPSIQGPGARSSGGNTPRESRATQLPRLGSDFTLSLRDRARKEPDGRKTD